jgi:hypothetical protein
MISAPPDGKLCLTAILAESMPAFQKQADRSDARRIATSAARRKAYDSTMSSSDVNRLPLRSIWASVCQSVPAHQNASSYMPIAAINIPAKTFKLMRSQKLKIASRLHCRRPDHECCRYHSRVARIHVRSTPPKRLRIHSIFLSTPRPNYYRTYCIFVQRQNAACSDYARRRFRDRTFYSTNVIA